MTAGGTTLGAVVKEWLKSQKKAGKIARNVNVSDVTLDHPTDPTNVKLHLSDGGICIMTIKRPIH